MAVPVTLHPVAPATFHAELEPRKWPRPARFLFILASAALAWSIPVLALYWLLGGF
jgi:hypothetical protein